MSDIPFWTKPKTIKLKDETRITLRPSKKTDLDPLWTMFNTLSKETLQYLPDPITRERVESWFKEIDYNTALPILSIIKENTGTRVISSASLTFQKGIYSHKARFGITIHDDYQNRGLGHILTGYMIEVAKERGIKKVELSAVAHNQRAIHLYDKFGFKQEGYTKMDHWNPILERYGDSVHMGRILP